MNELLNNASASTDAHASSSSSSSASDSSATARETPPSAHAQPESERDSSDDDDDGDGDSSNADPLHDEDADLQDEAWVNQHLRDNTPNKHGEECVQCPCCFTVLSVRCQPHERYEGQFRALFVLNCECVQSQRLKVNGKQFSEELFTPIACSTCHTEVAVMDASGVYHFCNVMY